MQHYRPVEELCSIVRCLLNEGCDEGRILAEFELFWEQLKEDDPYEDVVLDVMDFLTGWCSPHVCIQKTEK
ncbi:hypothetical protein QUF72_12495 [Desulfobacterales bacterium HSG2]|nr:hypothetical protein [Desulfobacterales bacterium HSG2]